MWSPIRPSSLVLYLTVAIFVNGFAQKTDGFGGLSDFGGDVSQYMTLLQGTSAFSFKPGSNPSARQEPEDDPKADDAKRSSGGQDSQGHRSSESSTARRRASKAGQRSESAIGDFGGDYGNYLQLLEGDSALGFNPQSDPIGDNQDLQSDVFGGGMTGKFWDMYKGSSSYDSLDDSDSSILDSSRRQSPELDQPEDESNPSRGESGNKKEENFIVALKPSKAKVSKIFGQIKSAIKAGDKNKIGKILDSLDPEKLISDEPDDGAAENVRKVLFESPNDDDDDDSTLVSRRRSFELDDVTTTSERKAEKSKQDVAEDNDNEDDYSKEIQKESESRSALKNLEDFVEKMRKNTPDPIATNKGLSMNYRNLTLYGLTEMKVCGKIRKGLGMGSDTWTSEICFPRLVTTVDCVTGPGVPFRGRVAAIFKDPKIRVTFKENGDTGVVHIISVKTVDTSGTKFVPTYDSSIPLNPWSKVSLSGYMVSRVKKILPSLVDKMILKISHVVENLDEK